MLETEQLIKNTYVITCIIAIIITRRKEQLLNQNNCKFLSVIVIEKNLVIAKNIQSMTDNWSKKKKKTMFQYNVRLRDRDDICLLCPSLTGLQSLVNTCSSYANSHNIVFNTKKSNGVLFFPKKFHLSCDPFVRLCSDCIIFSNSVTYLGMKLNSHLTDDDDILR